MNTATLDLITKTLVIATPIILIGWDVITITQGGRSISSLMAAEARHTTAIPFAWGILTGHFFAWVSRLSPEFSIRVWWWVGALLLVVCWDWYAHTHDIPGWMERLRYPMWWVLIGSVLGYFSWAQTGRWV